VLHKLATSPQTAQIYFGEARERFVGDDPLPRWSIHGENVSEKKRATIAEVLTVLFHSPEFWMMGPTAPR